MDKRKKGHIKKEISILKGSRKIHIGDSIWYWKSTSRTVIITKPNGKKYNVGCHTIVGCTPDIWEQSGHKRNSHMTPGKVKKYIEEKILK